MSNTWSIAWGHKTSSKFQRILSRQVVTVLKTLHSPCQRQEKNIWMKKTNVQVLQNIGFLCRLLPSIDFTIKRSSEMIVTEKEAPTATEKPLNTSTILLPSLFCLRERKENVYTLPLGEKKKDEEVFPSLSLRKKETTSMNQWLGRFNMSGLESAPRRTYKI